MAREIPDLNLQAGSLLHKLHVVRVQTHRILETLGSLQKIFFRLVDSSTSMPAEHTLHFAFDQGNFGHLHCLRVFTQSLQEEGLQGVGFGVMRMNFQQFVCVLQSFFIVFGIVELLSVGGDTASCL